MIFLPKGSIMLWNTVSITEHNRQPIKVSVERIEKGGRMANGTMRKYFIADKRTWSTSWEQIPDLTSETVDGKWGGNDIENFYNNTPGAFTLGIKTSSGTVQYTVMFTEFSKEIVKRGRYNAWNIDLTMEEV